MVKLIYNWGSLILQEKLGFFSNKNAAIMGRHVESDMVRWIKMTVYPGWWFGTFYCSIYGEIHNPN